MVPGDAPLRVDGPIQSSSSASAGEHDAGYLGLLRTVALVAVAVGGVGSLGFMLREGQQTPRFLLVLFVFWILAPFAAFAWAIVASKRWSVPTRATLYCLTLVVALGSLAVYGRFLLPPAESPRAFVFVITAPVTWALLAIVVPLAALISRGSSQRDNRS